MDGIFGLLLGFGLGAMMTVYFAHVDCADGEMRTPFANYTCSPPHTPGD